MSMTATLAPAAHATVAFLDTLVDAERSHWTLDDSGSKATREPWRSGAVLTVRDAGEGVVLEQRKPTDERVMRTTVRDIPGAIYSLAVFKACQEGLVQEGPVRR